MWLLAAFIGIPLIEIALFIQVGGLLGLLPTLLIVVVTAVLGAYLVRSQGLAVLRTVMTSLSALQDPREPLAHGAMILFSGALLLTPGFFTDAVGFALLVPGVRQWLFEQMGRKIEVHSTEFHASRTESHPQNSTIEGEFQDLDQPKNTTPGQSGWTKH